MKTINKIDPDLKLNVEKEQTCQIGNMHHDWRATSSSNFQHGGKKHDFKNVDGCYHDISGMSCEIENDQWIKQ